MVAPTYTLLHDCTQQHEIKDSLKICSTWILDSGLDYVLDYRQDYGIDFGLDWTVDSV